MNADFSACRLGLPRPATGPQPSSAVRTALRDKYACWAVKSLKLRLIPIPQPAPSRHPAKVLGATMHQFWPPANETFALRGEKHPTGGRGKSHRAEGRGQRAEVWSLGSSVSRLGFGVRKHAAKRHKRRKESSQMSEVRGLESRGWLQNH